MAELRKTREYELLIDGIQVQVTKKKMKNMYLRIDSEGKVRVSAPFRMPDREIRDFVRSRRAWIEDSLNNRPDVQHPWDMPSGPERDEAKKKCRERLEQLLPEIVPSCEKCIGVHAKEWRFRDMKTRWGTCNVAKERIWLNVWLGGYPKACVEYVVTHELVHLLERGHNSVFYGYMDCFLPEWRSIKKTLNTSEPIIR